MKKRTWILLLVLGAFVFACETNTYNEIEQETSTNSDPNSGSTTNTGTNSNTGTSSSTGSTTTSNVTYTNAIKSIMTKNCTSCHNNTLQSPSLTTYTQVKNAVSNDNVICAIQSSPGCKSMPPSGKMSQANIDLILLWKSQGYIQ